MKMLILEDDEKLKSLVIELIKETCTRNDLEILCCTSIKKAYELQFIHRFDCQIVDISVEDGLSWDYISKTKNSIRTLTTSGYENESKEKGVRFLPKPYTLIEFMKELSFLLDERSDFPEFEAIFSDYSKKQ